MATQSLKAIYTGWWMKPFLIQEKIIHLCSTGGKFMRNKSANMRYFLVFIVSLLFQKPLPATSIVPYTNLGDATTNSEVVVLARAINQVDAAVGYKVFQDTRFEVLENVKGALIPGDMFSVRPISHRTGDYYIDIAGDFSATPGKTYLLFLRKKGDVWSPVLLSYYVFEQIRIGSDEFLVPGSGEGLEVHAAAGSPSEPLAMYNTGLLLENLRQYPYPWDGSIGQLTMPTSANPALDRTLPTGCDFMLGNNSFLTRWVNVSLPIYYDDTGIPTGWTTYFTNILSTMNSNYLGINATNGGSASYNPACDGGPGFVNFFNSNLNGAQSALIMFDDPCDEFYDMVNCVGVLAYGGSFASNSTHIFDGQTWHNAEYGFVVVNVGAEPCYPGSSFERMMTHELTHVYRMDHLNPSLYPNQNMNPNCCNAINVKDRECMDYAYPSGLPVELSSFEARLFDNQKVYLNWITQTEKNNDHFTVQRSLDGLTYQTLAAVPAENKNTGGSYQWIDEHAQPGVNYYLLSQTDWDGSTRHLGIKSVNVSAGNPVLRIIPNPIEAEMLRIRVDLSADFDGVLQVVDKDGSIVLAAALSLEKGSTWVQKPLNGLPAGLYTLRVFDGQQQFSGRFTRI